MILRNVTRYFRRAPAPECARFVFRIPVIHVNLT
jgi:hypothetical protein